MEEFSHGRFYETSEMRFIFRFPTAFLLTSVLSDAHSQGTSFCELMVSFPSKWGAQGPSRTKRCEVVPAVFVRVCCLGCSALSPTSTTYSSLGRAQTFQLGLCFGMAPCFLNGSSPCSPSPRLLFQCHQYVINSHALLRAASGKLNV